MTSKRPHASLWVARTSSCAGFQGQSGSALAAIYADVHSELFQGLSQALLCWCYGDTLSQSCAPCSTAHASGADRHP